MNVLQIATVGEDVEPILVGIREYPVTKLVLIYPPEHKQIVDDLQGKLAFLKIQVDRKPIEGDMILMDLLSVVADIVNEEGVKFDDIYINVASGSKLMSCAALSAAFVNGVKAISVMDNMPVQLPVLKFSYSELISESKIKILMEIDKAGGGVKSLNQLSEISGIEKSLLSYHIRGGRDSKGLEELGLLDIDRATQGRLTIGLTALGKLMLVGRTRIPAVA